MAYPIGGPGSARFLVMEMHYDNPDMRSSMLDFQHLLLSDFQIERRQRRHYRVCLICVANKKLYYMTIQIRPEWFASCLMFDLCGKQKLYYRSLTKKGPWAEHLTSLPKRWVGALSTVSAFNHKRASCHVYSDLKSLKQIIGHKITYNVITS